jgi:hypothetical protein
VSVERSGGPGPRTEIGGGDTRQKPHVTENDRGAPLQADSPAPNDIAGSAANAHGHDTVESHKEVRRVDDESAYEGRPGEDKDRHETDMP